MKRAFRYAVAAFIVTATMTACGDGDGSANLPGTQRQYEWVALEQLLLPTPLPENGKYAILVGEFAVVEGANNLHLQVTALGLLSSIIPVVDKDGQHSFFVSAGSFESLDEAREHRLPISRDLRINDPLSIILLPPEN
ncbi:SPOR domain-containing protein [Geobacter sp. DSM 9736]|uniref:SPOR domain-containing protein n=1 Tax=Geobacter sp. DSM 9736 TaxID=1277350 RepID=UPI0012FD46C8|nr:SPOR domain-containing protein [Geobacter sp. DSM 9736]